MSFHLFSENSSMSPRISFSHDLCLSDTVQVEGRSHYHSDSSSRLNPSIDFDFCTHESLDHESSSADELFSNGKILPLEVKKKTTTTTTTTTPQKVPSQMAVPLQLQNNETGTSEEDPKKDQSSKESKVISNEAEEKQSSKSFWRFKRSSSLNCHSGYGRRSGLCPLPLLSRSNSTGSTPNAKQSSQKQPLKLFQSPLSSSSLSSSSSGNNNSSRMTPLAPYEKSKKPPLRKSNGFHGNNSIRVDPVLHVRSENLFGLGSIFTNNGKDKNTIKKK